VLALNRSARQSCSVPALSQLPSRTAKSKSITSAAITAAERYSAGCRGEAAAWSGDIRLLSQLPDMEPCEPPAEMSRAACGDGSLLRVRSGWRCRRVEDTNVRRLAFSPTRLNPAATQTSVALCRVAATPGSAGRFSQSMEAEMESRAKRRWRAAVHQHCGPAHMSRRRSLPGIPVSWHWPL
jgi:hypothetical protein